MGRTSRPRRSRRAIERLETRWLFSMSVGGKVGATSQAHASHTGGCCCPTCGSLSGFVKVDNMVYLPPGSELTKEQIQTLAKSDHGGGCGCPLCQAALSGSANSSTDGSGPQNFDNSGNKWPQSGGRGNPLTITYSMSNLLTEDLGGSLSSEQLYAAVEEALGLWAKYAPLNFVEVVDSGPAVSDNEYSAFGRPNIRFGQHPEDGRFNVLAHAFYPDGGGRAGDVHLDSDETWTVVPSFNTIDVIEVLTHELGHSLGLGHEDNNDAIMNPFYGGRYDGPGTGFLLQDDINGIRAIYGTGVGSVTPLERTPQADEESFTLEEDTPFASVESVLANDSDPQGGDLTAELVDSAAHGDVILNANGTFTYTPDANFFGEDSFTYLATNGTFSSAPTTVTLVVKPTLDLPTVNADAYSVRTGASLRTGLPSESVVKAGSVWKYLDDGSNQGTAWREFDFDDSGWASGPAQLGYGEGDEATQVSFGDDTSNRHITTYFRKEIELTDVALITTLQLNLQRDDGAAIYLNGVQIARSNLSSTATATTTALIDITGSSESRFFSFNINVANLPAGTLREGVNVLAVEIHQSRADSDDLTFDLKLDVVRNVQPNPTLNDPDLDRTGLVLDVLSGPDHGTLEIGAGGALFYTPTPGYVGQDVVNYRVRGAQPATIVAQGAVWRYLDTGEDLGTDWIAPAFVDSGWSEGDAQFGYGDGDEATAINFGNPSDRHATTYFRKDFTVADPALIESLAARVLRDDAAAIYLNGVEIYRDTNLPADAGHAVYTGDPVDDENAFVEFAVPVELLVAGENVLAVEVHQAAANDTDLSFDLELLGVVLSTPTTITFDVTPSLSGDVNFDGSVDLDDLNLVRSNFGGDASVLLGDSNGDGVINLTDLNAVRNNFGASLSPAVAISAAPPVSTPPASTRVVSVASVDTATKNARLTAATKSSAWDVALTELLEIDASLTTQSTLFARKRSLLRG